MEGSCDVENASGGDGGTRRVRWQRSRSGRAATAAKPAAPQASTATVKLGFITKFPVDFFFVLQNAAKKWDKATRTRRHLRAGEERDRRRR